MHLLLILALSLVFLVRNLKPFFHWIPFAVSAVFAVHFIFSANTAYSTLWKDERISSDFHNLIHEDALKQNRRFITVGGYQTNGLNWAWYNYINNKFKLPNLQVSDYYTNNDDYILYKAGDYAKNRLLYDSLYTDKFSEITLGRRKTIKPACTVLHKTGIASPQHCTEEYFGFFESFETDSFFMHSCLVEAELLLVSPVKAPQLYFVCSVSDSSGETIIYQSSALHWFRYSFDSNQEVLKPAFWTPCIKKIPARFSIYLWNPKKIAFQILNADLSVKLSED
jgi:hypothetical protein